MLHVLKNKFILMFFFFNYFFCPLNKIVIAVYSVFIDLSENTTFNIYFQLLFSDIWFFAINYPVANITFCHDSFEHDTFLTL